MQGRIAKLAEGYGVDFAALHQDDARGLNKLLISRVYPEQPDFSAWDAVDEAFAKLEEASATFPIPCSPNEPALSSAIPCKVLDGVHSCAHQSSCAAHPSPCAAGAR